MGETTRLERASRVVHGDRSELRLESGSITITKEATTQVKPTSVTVSIEQVRNVTLEKPMRGQHGWLHLSVVDGSPAPPSEMAASSDPYTLPITTRHLAAARRLARLITDHVRRRGLPHESSDTRERIYAGVIVQRGTPATTATAARPAASTPPPRVPPPAPDAPGSGAGMITQLRQLADLHRDGALTDAEFEHAKRQVLGG